MTLAEQRAAWEKALALSLDKAAALTTAYRAPNPPRHDARWWQERSFADSAPGTARSGAAGADDRNDIPTEGEGSGEVK